MDPELKREIIMENYLHPQNREEVNDPKYIKVNSNNESCIDNINLYLLIEDEKIKDVKFMGEACAISTASTSIMIKNIIGKTVQEALAQFQNFENMVEEKDYDESMLGEAICYSDIYKQQNRKHCALLPWLGLKKALEQERTK